MTPLTSKNPALKQSFSEISGENSSLVGGFNPSEKNISQKWESSPNKGEHKKSLKPPPSSW